MHRLQDEAQNHQPGDQQAREAGNRGADDGPDFPAVQEKPEDAQDERKTQRAECGQRSKCWKRRASARPQQKDRREDAPRHKREDEADGTENSPPRSRRRNRCARIADGSDFACRHGAILYRPSKHTR